MRVFKDYNDYKENKNDNENGVTQYHLDKYYNGDIELAKKDNESNINCFNCYDCDNCDDCDDYNNCYYCIHCENLNECEDCNNCDNCNNCGYCIHCENFNDRNRLYATSYISNIKEKDNENVRSSKKSNKKIR